MEDLIIEDLLLQFVIIFTRIFSLFGSKLMILLKMDYLQENIGQVFQFNSMDYSSQLSLGHLH